MAQKIVISKAGYNAFTESNKNSYIFHSDYNTFKILAEGKLTSQSVTGNPTTFQVAHGKNYIPAVMAFIKYPDGYVTLPEGNTRDSSITTQRYWEVEIDNTYIYFVCYKGSSANYSVDVKYYIFETPGN